MSLYNRIRDCARFTPENYRPFVVDDETVGRIAHPFADTLVDFPRVFDIEQTAVRLNPSLKTFIQRTEAVAQVLESLRGRGLIPGWRDEPYPVSTGFYDQPMFTIERAAAVKFGTRAYGVNLNGYVLRDDGLHMWIAKRSARKPVAPGKLDHIVAGGQPVGISVYDNLVKECWEEAGIPEALVAGAMPVGTISYLTERDEGLRHSLFFNFDICLPDDFQPRPTDDEVETFYLWPMSEVITRMRDTEDFKFDVPMGILDFAIRHGFIGPDGPDYVDIAEGLRLGQAGLIEAN